ncbi:MAG: hypothetical protein ABJC89_18740 [Acidobacteriota bacterium]
MSHNTDKQDTSEYSASKAPETVEQTEEKKPPTDDRLQPGGAHGAAVPTGMSAMDPEDVPGLDPGTDTPPRTTPA